MYKSVKWIAFVTILIMTISISSLSQSFAQTKRIVVWNGESVKIGGGWANPSATCTIGTQTREVYSPAEAVEFRFKGNGENGWLGCGWNWVAFKVGEYGTDISAMKNFSFWLKVKGTTSGMSFNLLCNGEPALDQPQHHTDKVIVSNYCPSWKDGEWHQIIVSLTDLFQPKEFDVRHVAEMQFFNTGAGDGSFFIDDLAFDDGTVTKQ